MNIHEYQAKDLLKAYGVEVIVCPTEFGPGHPDSYYGVADRLAAEIEGSYQPNQYSNQVKSLSTPLQRLSLSALSAQQKLPLECRESTVIASSRMARTRPLMNRSTKGRVRLVLTKVPPLISRNRKMMLTILSFLVPNKPWFTVRL